MKANIVVDILPPIPYLTKVWFSSYGPKCRQSIVTKAWRMKLIYCVKINLKVLYKLIVSRLVCIAEHAQSIHNKFTISIPATKKQLKENVKDEVHFFLADKCQMFPQIDIIILGACGKACPNYPNVTK